jgi:hypothetical protein
VDRQEGKGEREVGAWEDGKGLDEDVGDGLVTGKVGVELVAVALRSAMANKEVVHAEKRNRVAFR